MKRNLLTIILLLVLGFNYGIEAQSKETKEKIKQLKGKVEKILIVTDEGELELTGEDAEAILKKLKKKHLLSKNVWTTKKGHVYHVKEDGDGELKTFTIKVDSDEDHEKDIDIDVEIDEDGEKKTIIIRKGEDGEEKVLEWIDESRNKLLKKIDEDAIVIMDSEDEDINILIEKISDGDSKTITKKIEIDKDNGKLKVTETITENGEEKVNEYEGEEAKKFLKEIEDKDDLHLEFIDGHKKFKKVYIQSHCENECGSKEVKIKKKIKVKKKEKIDKDKK